MHRNEFYNLNEQLKCSANVRKRFQMLDAESPIVG
jgi:hypothetical protein